MLRFRHQKFLAIVGLLLCGVYAVVLWRNPTTIADPMPTRGARADELLPAIDPNTATADEMAALPNIGPSKAAAVVRYREQGHRFASPADLEAVHGWGPALVEGATPYLRFGEPKPNIE